MCAVASSLLATSCIMHLYLIWSLALEKLQVELWNYLIVIQIIESNRR